MAERTTFKGEQWMFVGNTESCPYSILQVQKVRDLGLDVKGAVLCNHPDHRDAPVCKKVPAFPCFCNVETQLCIPGLRETMPHFNYLQWLSDKQQREP